MDRILDAIIRANKLGRKNIMVVDYLEPSSATDNGRLILMIQEPPLQGADELAWEDK